MFRKPLFLFILACAACGSSPKPIDTQPKVEPKASASAVAVTPPPEASSSEDPAPSEDDEEPKVPSKTFEELQKAALACPTEEDGSIESNCEAFDAWTNEQPAFDEGRANPQLLEMLVSKDVKTRILAAERLRMTFHEENLDAANAEKLLVAAESERDEAVIRPMVEMITGQNLVKVGKIDRAVAIGKAHPSEDFRERMLLHIGFYNRDKAVLAWAREASVDKSSAMRNAALNAADHQTELLPDDACKIVNGFRTDKDDFVKNAARHLLARRRKCSAFFGKLLDDLGSVALKPDTSRAFGVHYSYGQALTSLCDNDALDPKLRQRALKAAKRFADSTEVSSAIRQYGKEAAALCEARSAKK